MRINNYNSIKKRFQLSLNTMPSQYYVMVLEMLDMELVEKHLKALQSEKRFQMKKVQKEKIY
ncbi:hypothetical protein B4U78_016750 [Microbacterium esteraromaticum]|nr:hypothetical protein B4U78_016750 [Microbacterium esteraromaticum]